MTLILNLPPDVVDRIALKATAEGMSVEDYIVRFLARFVGITDWPLPSAQPRAGGSPDESREGQA